MSNKGVKRLSRNVHDFLRSGTFLFDLPRVVEELVNNSVDATSTKVVVSLSVRSFYIKVEDDGHGVSRDGLVILGEKNATSKVDLLADAGSGTETLGFRGEGLSSISDVSLLEIRSKARGNPNAYCKIIKSSKCLFFGIDDQREDVGTTVIVRDLFYNQPIRRKFMQSSLRKVLHSVKKCVFRIALVHPNISFKVIEIEGEHELLCTNPSLSSLPLVTDGFGDEVSSSLREIVYSCGELALSGYISGPSNAFSSKAFQYVYINSRFVCNGPIHNLINSLATSFRSNFAKWRDSSENHCRKRQKTREYPAYLFNLCCPMSSYDLIFEPSKTRVEFKDWSIILSFFEQAILSKWEQFPSNLFQGASASREASFQNSGPLREDAFHDDTMKKSEIISLKENFNSFRNLVSDNHVSRPVNTSSSDASNYKKHNQLCNDRVVYGSFPKRCHSKGEFLEVSNSFFQHEVNSSMYTSINCKHSKNMNCKSCVPCEIVGDLYDSPLACDSSSKTFALMENEIVNSASCSTSYVLGEHHDFLKESVSDVEECTTGESWYNNCLHGSDNLIFKENITNSFFEERSNSQGLIRKCQKWTQQDSPRFEISPSVRDHACFSEDTNLGFPKVVDHIYADSMRFSHFGSADPWITRTPSRLHDFSCDSTLKENHVYMQEADCKDCVIGEMNSENLYSVLNETREVLADLNSTDSAAVNHNSSIKHLQYDHLLEHFTPTNGGLASIFNEEKGCLLTESPGIRHEDICSTSFQNFAIRNCDKDSESPTKNKEFQNSLFSYVREIGLRRSHSAPPFYKGKKKFPILCCVPTDSARENCKMKTFHRVDVPGLNCQLEPYNASQPCMQPITECRQPCLQELNYEKSNQCNVIEMQTCEEFDCDSVADDIETLSTSLTKWRTRSMQPGFNHKVVFPQKMDVLDVSSGLLHLAGSSLVPAVISKECLDNARVLLQLDRKFIPVVASGILVIIDQHAADERIRLEELRKKVLHGELRNSAYLNPEHELVLPEMGYQLLQKYAEQIKNWGWICNIQNQCSESFGRSMNFLRQHKCRVNLVAVPHILGTDLTGKDLLEYIEQLVETDGSSLIPPAVLRILNNKACRGAIMFGDALLPSECSLIVEELKATSLCFQCAHGRPTTVPLLNMSALHEQISKLDVLTVEDSNAWHGLRRHTPSIRRARRRLESCKRFLYG